MTTTGLATTTEASALGRRPLRETIRELLLERILTGEYRPGERLVEYRLAEELGVSQAPVRDALRDLEGLRLLEFRPHLGARVRQVDEAELLAAHAVRVALEETAARLADLGRVGGSSALQAEVDAMRDAAASGDELALVRHSVAFHRKVVEASGNEVLMAVWNALGIELHTARGVAAEAVPLAEAADTHQVLLDALAEGDHERAAALARSHAEQWAPARVDRAARTRLKTTEKNIKRRSSPR
jgi:DNA-binding GntR family transcriptional regulator